jgi:hypothetical protein
MKSLHVLGMNMNNSEAFDKKLSGRGIDAAVEAASKESMKATSTSGGKRISAR